MRSPKFNVLWQRLTSAMNEIQDERMLATLKNYSDKKEYIMRKLGVVSEQDIQRIIKLKASKQSSRR